MSHFARPPLFCSHAGLLLSSSSNLKPWTGSCPRSLSCCSVCLECPSQIFAWPSASLQSGLCSHGTGLERSVLATCLPLPLSSVLSHDTLSGLCSTYQYLKWYCVYFVPPLSLKCRLQNSCLYHLPPFPHTQSIVWHERYSVNIWRLTECINLFVGAGWARQAFVSLYLHLLRDSAARLKAANLYWDSSDG